MKKIFLVLLFINALLYSQDKTPPAVPAEVKAISYELHADVIWRPNSESDLAGYKVYKFNGTSYQLAATVKKYRSFYYEWIGSVNTERKYKVTAYDISGNESAMSDEVTAATHSMTDNEFLDMTQRAAFRYFWDWADPNSGIARERWHPNEADVTCTIGGTGFGITSIIAGAERGFITREQAAERIYKIVNFLANKADRFHGVLPHWINGTTGKVIQFGKHGDYNDNGGDIVEHAFVIQGVMAARQYFNQSNSTEEQIRFLSTKLWEETEWDWYLRNNGYSWHWNPTQGFSDIGVRGWNETMICYILGIASNTHPVNEGAYRSGWVGPNFTSLRAPYGFLMRVGQGMAGPLFFTHYSFIGFDPRDKKDMYTNYFVHNQNQSKVNHAYCKENPKKFIGYNENCWGLTASYSKPGVDYLAHEPGTNNDNGTIAPTAALSSMPYTPKESLAAIKYFYRTFQNKLWGDFGFKDAFNLSVSPEWFSDGYLAIDQGPIVSMIENYRSETLWKYFMMNPEINIALDKIGFVKDVVNINNEEELPKEFKLNQNYPNPFNPETIISYQIPTNSNVTLKVYDLLGREVATLVDGEQQAGIHDVKLTINNDRNSPLNTHHSSLSSGFYFYTLRSNDFIQTKKMMLIK